LGGQIRIFLCFIDLIVSLGRIAVQQTPSQDIEWIR